MRFVVLDLSIYNDHCLQCVHLPLHLQVSANPEPPDQPKAKRRKIKRRKKRVLEMPKEELSAVRNGDKLTDIHIVGAMQS